MRPMADDQGSQINVPCVLKRDELEVLNPLDLLISPDLYPRPALLRVSSGIGDVLRN